MKKESIKQLLVAIVALIAFALWTLLLRIVDVQAIGPRESAVGLATVNAFFHNLTGVHMWLYTVTDWMGLVPVAFGFGFAILGLAQWIKRRKVWHVDPSILILGGFYIVVLAAYLFFEEWVVNYRPVLINGYLEASYPSSTTLLVLCVMPTTIIQLRSRIKCKLFRQCVTFGIAAFIAFMMIGRLLSGVHWLTDIVGGILLSVGLVSIYRFLCAFEQK
ncbi:MAG: phosphatase PAP2 family protein [Oscillospiraceae bacterium]|nr:phosphatase PAP2 family protein [Oscillospiraceae bacterium]